MIFVDSNVFIYAVGRPHPLRDPARAFFIEALDSGTPLVSSAEVLQELLHVYLPSRRLDALDQALTLATSRLAEIWSVEPEDVKLARHYVGTHPELRARDLVHLACCRRRDVRSIHTYDRALAAAF